MAIDTVNLQPFERQLMSLLQEEYSFYQSLYILLDRQRDFIKYEKDDHLLDLYAEIERCQRRIKESDEKINTLRAHDPSKFSTAVTNMEIKKLVNSITTLVKKNIDVINENSAHVRVRHEKIKDELEDLQTSAKIMQYLQPKDSSPQFINGKT